MAHETGRHWGRWFKTLGVSTKARGCVPTYCLRSVTIYGSHWNIKLEQEKSLKMRLQGKILKLCRILLHATKESGLYFVGYREPWWISKLSVVITLTSPEAEVRRGRGKADWSQGIGMVTCGMFMFWVRAMRTTMKGQSPLLNTKFNEGVTMPIFCPIFYPRPFKGSVDTQYISDE